MFIDSRTAGKIEVDERQIVWFPQGILGFESHTQFAILDANQAPFYWLQSLSDANTTFVLISPDVFRTDYQLSLQSSELDVLEIMESQDSSLIQKDGETAELLVLSIVTFGIGNDNMTANLQGPIVINTKKYLGMQGIQTDNKWKTRHFIFEEMNSKISAHKKEI